MDNKLLEVIMELLYEKNVINYYEFDHIAKTFDAVHIRETINAIKDVIEGDING